MAKTQTDNFFYESDPDVLLMLEFQKGDQASFENLMRKYYKRIFNFLYRLTGDSASSEDLAQEVFLKVYKAGPGYQPRAKFQTWVYTIAKNAALNELRRKRPMVSLESQVMSDHGDQMRRQIADETADLPGDDLQKQEKVQAVKQAIAGLSDHQRMVVVLYRYEGLSYGQIAQSMEMSVSAVKSLLTRARANLRKNLGRFVRE